MKLYFDPLYFLFGIYYPCTLHFFVCCAHHQPVWNLCGWPFSLDSIVLMSGGDMLSAAVLKGNVRNTFVFFTLISFFCSGFSLIL